MFLMIMIIAAMARTPPIRLRRPAGRCALYTLLRSSAWSLSAGSAEFDCPGWSGASASAYYLSSRGCSRWSVPPR